MGKEKKLDKTYFILFFFFLNGHTHGTWKFLGQELNLNQSCDLRHSCGNAKSFNSLHQAGDQTPTSTATRSWILNPLCHIRDSCITSILNEECYFRYKK